MFQKCVLYVPQILLKLVSSKDSFFSLTQYFVYNTGVNSNYIYNAISRREHFHLKQAFVHNFAMSENSVF